jgi:hypothetical protein
MLGIMDRESELLDTIVTRLTTVARPVWWRLPPVIE